MSKHCPVCGARKVALPGKIAHCCGRIVVINPRRS
jgi:hypothetical protein